MEGRLYSRPSVLAGPSYCNSIPAGIVNELLYGKDGTERIVGIVTHDDESVMIYVRNEDGSVRQYIEPYWSFFLTNREGAKRAQEVHVPEWGRGRHKVLLLNQTGTSYSDALILSKSRKGNSGLYTHLNDANVFCRRVGSAATQYFLQTGRTLFKGMSLSDVRRMQIDIETISPRGGFSNAMRPEDEIVIVSVSDNHGFKRVFHSYSGRQDDVFQYCETERDIIIALMRAILIRDPDIIEGHNFFSFDLPYILERAKLNEVKFAIGRNRRAPRGRLSSKKFAERDVEFRNNEIGGRHIIDTMFLASEYDVFKRDMPSYGLKAVAKYFGVAREGRVYVDGDSITHVWQTDPNRLLEYALDDALETLQISYKLMPATFELTKMVPATLQQIHVGGVGRAIENLFLREYLRNREGIPKPEVGGQIFGGMTGVAQRGVVKDLLYIDVASLYPFIMLNYDVKPESDTLDVFQRLLRLLTDLRLETKKKMNDAEDGSEEKVMLDAQQSAYKRIINSFYGALGYARFAWNDMSEADRVATRGQAILVQMMQMITKFGGQIVEVDTDGILCTRPEGVTNALEFVKEKIEPGMPRGIVLDLDGEFDAMLSYRPKNYALLAPNGKIKIKGGAFKSRGVEGFARKWMKQAIECILREDFETLRSSYIDLKMSLLRGDVSIEDIAVKKNLKIPLQEYIDKRERGDPKQAQYEIWMNNPDAFVLGDPVRYYIRRHTRRKKGAVGYLDAALLADYEPKSENRAYYVERLKAVAEKFRPFFMPDDFAYIFDSDTTSQASLFADVARDLNDIELPIEQIATIETFQRQLSTNLAKYDAYYH